MVARLAALVLAAALLVAYLASRGADAPTEVLEAGGARATNSDDAAPDDLARAPTVERKERRMPEDWLIGPHDLPDAEDRARADEARARDAEDTLPPGFSIELPDLSIQGDPEVTSPLPDAYELEAFDGPLVRAEYEDGTLWFEAQRALDADGAWVRDGMWNCWHSNGELHEQGNYREGVEQGEWSWWYPDGNRMATGQFVNGEFEGAWAYYYDTGDLAVRGQYIAGEGTGTWTLYRPDGGRQAEGPFVNGRANGEWTVWTETGAVDPERSGVYVDGVMVDTDQR